MKQNKRRTATVVYIFIFMLTVSGCVRKGKEQDKVYQETGMFEWSEEAVCEPEEALYLAKELGITKWYQETNGMTEVEATGKFVKALHNRKIEVYALLGAVEWGRSYVGYRTVYIGFLERESGRVYGQIYKLYEKRI